jgi:hypothetical protein
LFLEQFFKNEGFIRIPSFDAFSYIGKTNNSNFDKDLVELFLKEAGYLKYGDKFIKY